MDPLIIEVALNGATPKTRNPNVPREPDEVAADAIACIEAGAHIIHSHVNWSTDHKEQTRQYLDAYRAVIAEHPEAILYPTMGTGNNVQECTQHMGDLAEKGVLRMGYLDPGSCNLATSSPEGGPGKMQMVYANGFQSIDYALSLLDKHKLVPSMAMYEPNFLRGAILYNKAGRMPNGFVKFYFSGEKNFIDEGSFLFFGLNATRAGLEAYLEMMEMEGCTMPWATAVMGGDSNRCGMTKLAIERGGHVRIGLEDYAGDRKPTNLELVKEVIDIAKQCGRPLASMNEATKILGLRR
jgi:3-keto-5-aminohexanoate cleavage enzyme